MPPIICHGEPRQYGQHYLVCLTKHSLSWYKRDELGFRIAIFASSMTTAGAFGGLLAVWSGAISALFNNANNGLVRPQSRIWMESVTSLHGKSSSPSILQHLNYLWTRAWIFILEGLVTVVAGVASFFIIQDYPTSALFLSENERDFAIRRLRRDEQSSTDGKRIQWRSIKKSFKDWKTWLTAISSLGSF